MGYHASLKVTRYGDVRARAPLTIEAFWNSEDRCRCTRHRLQPYPGGLHVYVIGWTYKCPLEELGVKSSHEDGCPV